MDDALYQAILARRSVRRYDKKPLNGVTLAQVREIVDGVEPLIPGNCFEVEMHNVAPDEDLVASLGAYGRIVTPPHYLIPYITGERHLLTDLGYRVEQITVRMTALGIGTCYVGALSREEQVRAQFELPENSRIGAFLAFGFPSKAPGGRLFNTVMRMGAGATNKHPVERLFFLDTFDMPAMPPTTIAPLIEAGRNAPSAGNAQPWRFLWHSGHLYLFVEQASSRYNMAGTNYGLYDGGICLGNVALAMESMEMEGGWKMLAEDDVDLPPYPNTLQPLAVLQMTSGG